MEVKQKPLNVITLGQTKSDNYSRKIIISCDFYVAIFSKCERLKCDHIEGLITLTVITLNGFHCIL